MKFLRILISSEKIYRRRIGQLWNQVVFYREIRIEGKLSLKNRFLEIIYLFYARLANKLAEIHPLMSFKPDSSKRGLNRKDQFFFRTKIALEFLSRYSDIHHFPCPRLSAIPDIEEQLFLISAYIKKKSPRTNLNGIDSKRCFDVSSDDSFVRKASIVDSVIWIRQDIKFLCGSKLNYQQIRNTLSPRR